MEPEHLRSLKRSEVLRVFFFKFVSLVRSPQGKNYDQSIHVAGRNGRHMTLAQRNYKFSCQRVNAPMALINDVGLEI